MQKSTGKTPPELDLPEIPHAGTLLHRAWQELAMTRQASMGVSPISWAEVSAWQAVMGVRLSPWEAETLQAMDRAGLADQSAGKS